MPKNEQEVRIFKCGDCGVKLPMKEFRAHIKQQHGKRACKWCNTILGKDDPHRYCRARELAKSSTPVPEPVPEELRDFMHVGAYFQGKLDPWWKSKLARNRKRERE